MQESPKIKAYEKPEDLNEKVEEICTRLTEMDTQKQSVRTLAIKDYMEKIIGKDGKYNPLYINQLEKMVNDLYFGEYLEMKEIKRGEDFHEKDPGKRKFYAVAFEGSGFRGMNFIEFWRNDPTVWRSSDIGRGYTTTASTDPQWLEIISKEEWKKIPGKDWDEGVNYYMRDKARKGMVVGIDAVIHEIDFKHATGDGHIHRFEFKTKKDADKFSELLMKKSVDQAAPDVKLNWMRDENKFFKWDQMGLIDPKYGRIMGQGFIDEIWEKYENPYDYSERRVFFSQAFYTYRDQLVTDIKKLTENEGQQGRIIATKKAESMDFKNESEKRNYINRAELEARWAVLDWSKIEKLLKNHENGVLEIYEKLAREKIEEKKKEIGPMLNSVYELVNEFLESDYITGSENKLVEEITTSTKMVRDWKIHERIGKLSKVVATENFINKPAEEKKGEFRNFLEDIKGIFEERYGSF